MTDEPRVRVVRYEDSRERALGRPRDMVPGEGPLTAFRRALAGVPVPEEHKWKRIGMRVPPQWWKDVDTIVRRQYGSSRASILRAALWEYLDKHMPEVVAWEEEDIRQLDKIDQLRNTHGRDHAEAKSYREKADTLEAKLAARLAGKEERDTDTW